MNTPASAANERDDQIHCDYCAWLATFHPDAVAHLTAWNGFQAGRAIPQPLPSSVELDEDKLLQLICNWECAKRGHKALAAWHAMLAYITSCAIPQPAAEPVSSALYDAVARLIKAKGRFHTEQNYNAVVAAFDLCTAPDRAPSTDSAADIAREAAIRLEVDRLKSAERFEAQVKKLMGLIKSGHKFDWPHTDAFDDGGVAYREAESRLAIAAMQPKGDAL